MTPSEIGSVIAQINRLFPKSDWTAELHELFARRLAKIDLSAMAAGSVIERYKLDTRRRSPDPGTIIKKLWDEYNERANRASEQEPPKAMAWSKQVALTHKMPVDWPPEEILGQYHERCAMNACSDSIISGNKMPPIMSSDQAFTRAWYGFAADLEREGWERDKAEYAATAKFGDRGGQVMNPGTVGVTFGTKRDVITFAAFDALIPHHDLQGLKAKAKAKTEAQAKARRATEREV